MTMAGSKAPLSLYISNLKTFLLNAATQKKWRECEKQETRGRWLKHFILVPAYAGMFVLVMFFLESLQVDTSEFTWVSIIGYACTFALLYVSGDAMISRLRKKEEIHKYSHDSDWMFLILLFLTALTGILMHVLRIMDWPLSTYYMYVIQGAFDVQTARPLPEGGEGKRGGGEGVAGTGNAQRCWPAPASGFDRETQGWGIVPL
jgi:hypothetical protein